MDKLTISIESLPKAHREHLLFTLNINAKPLDRLLQAFHIDQGWQNPSDTWGMHSGIYSRQQLQHFLKKRGGEMVQCCCSGEPEFASIYCDIYNDGNFVTWSGFVDFMFNDKSKSNYKDYQLFGPFTFDAAQYEQEIMNVLNREL